MRLLGRLQGVTPNGTLIYLRIYEYWLTSSRLTTGVYAPPLTSRPGFGVSLAIKDANHALSIAKDNGVELPSVELARDNMSSAREYGGECLDSSSMYGILRQKAGLAFWNEKSRQGGK